MRYHDMITFWFLFLCLLFASRLVGKFCEQKHLEMML